MKHTHQRKRWITTREIAVMGLMLAMNIVVSRFLSFRPIPTVRLSFGFLPTALMAMLVGPWKAGLVSAVWDIVNVVLFQPFAPFPGFTLSAFLGAMFYGLFLHRRKVRWYHVLVPVLINTLFVNLFLNTLWNIMIFNLPMFEWTSWAAMLPERLMSNGVMLPIRFVSILFFVNTPQLRRVLMKFSSAPEKKHAFDRVIDRLFKEKESVPAEKSYASEDRSV